MADFGTGTGARLRARCTKSCCREAIETSLLLLTIELEEEEVAIEFPEGDAKEVEELKSDVCL